jgi:hypothetical protein
MKKFVILLLLSTYIYGQKEDDKTKKQFYLEDQIYTAITFNTLRNLPSSISQSGFSNSIMFGFIKDLPINKKRNFGFGLGVGYSLDTYFQNIKISKINTEIIFENFQEDENFSRNKIVLHNIDIPFEIRYRTSTIDKYKFWRIYAGLKLKYNLYAKASFNNNGTNKVKITDQVNNINYGATLAVGHGTWNIHFYYGLKSIFKQIEFNNEGPLDAEDFKIGLIFYIL